MPSTGVSDQPSVGLSFSRDTCVLRTGRKIVDHVCCVTHVKKTKTVHFSKKRRGSPRCSGLDWQHIAPQHRVNNCMVLMIMSL